MDMIRARITVKGKVQRVGFREIVPWPVGYVGTLVEDAGERREGRG